jgi:GNAT superfamily N-acetyltransferase
MEVRHVEIGEQEFLSIRHPELLAHRPDLVKPALANNPVPVELDFPYLFYALEDGRVVGHFMSFPDTLVSEDGTFRWVWNLGLYTEPHYRGRGVAEHIVQHQLDEYARRDMIWGGVFSSYGAIRLYQRMNFSMPGYATRLCILRNARPFLRHHIPSRIAVSAGGIAFDAIFTAAQSLLFRKSHIEKKYFVESVDGPRFSALLANSLVRPEKFSWGRDASWFEARRAPNDQIYGVTRRGESEPCAFLIIRDRLVKTRTLAGKYTGFKMMSVMDFGQLDQGSDIANALVSAVVTLFRRSDADIAEFVTSSPTIQATARSFGFFPFGAGMSFKFMAPPQNPLHGIKTTLADWHLSHYCGDAFGFE